MIHFQNQILENQRLELNSMTEAYYLGPNLTLRNCTLALKLSARALIVTTVRFEECRIEAKRTLTDYDWYDAFITRCSFSGKFIGSCFGNWPEENDPGGGIEYCDFSEAILDGCRFVGCDMSTIKLPPWPCFTILDPVSRLAELQAVPWPGNANILVSGTVDEFPPNTVAETYYAPAVEKL